MTKRLLLIYDVDGWAWHRRAMGIQKYADKSRFDVMICENDLKTSRLREHGPFDAVFSLGWMDISTDPHGLGPAKLWAQVSNAGCMYEYNRQSEDLRQRCASLAKNATTAQQKFPNFHGVITIDHRTVDFLRDLNPNTHLLNTGCDHNVWRCIDPPRTDGPLRVGWIGKAYDTLWTSKGYHEALMPLMARFENDKRIEFRVHRGDYKTNCYGTEDLLEWYNQNDVLLITSCADSTPSTLIESMACGRGFVSTNVGIALNVLGDSQQPCGRVVAGYHTESLAPASVAMLEHELRTLIDNRAGCLAMGAYARQHVERHLNWQQLADVWCETLTEPSNVSSDD